MNQKTDPARCASYVFIAIIALVIGLLLGVAGRDTKTGSRIQWPQPTQAKSSFPP